MTLPIPVQIIGAPVACAEGVTDPWREVAAFAKAQLGHYFGNAVRVDYFDLFDPGCPPLPPESQLPLVLIEGQLFSSGGKISIPGLRRQVETLIQVSS